MRLWLAVLLLAANASATAVERVISLAPSLSEIVVELGATNLLVGVLDGGERPDALRDVPSVGRYGQLDMERLLSLQPDLLLLWPGSVGPAQREQLKGLNIPIYVAEPHSLEQLGSQIEAIARQLGRAEDGRQLVTPQDAGHYVLVPDHLDHAPPPHSLHQRQVVLAAAAVVVDHPVAAEGRSCG